jgi:hypothetical protein
MMVYFRSFHHNCHHLCRLQSPATPPTERLFNNDFSIFKMSNTAQAELVKQIQDLDIAVTDALVKGDILGAMKELHPRIVSLTLGYLVLFT